MRTVGAARGILLDEGERRLEGQRADRGDHSQHHARAAQGRAKLDGPKGLERETVAGKVEGSRRGEMEEV